MARYEMFDSKETKAFMLTLEVPYSEVAGYIKAYGKTYESDDTNGDEFEVARMAIAFAAFRTLAEDELHENMKYLCREKIDWSPIHPDDERISGPYEGAPTPQGLLDNVMGHLEPIDE